MASSLHLAMKRRLTEEVIGDNSLNLFDRHAIVDWHIAFGDREFLGLVNDGTDVGVIDNFNVATGIDELGGTDADLKDFAAPAIDDDDVTDLEVAFEDDEDTGKDISDQGLGTKTNDKS